MVHYLTTGFRGMQGRAISSTRSRGREPPAVVGVRFDRYDPDIDGDAAKPINTSTVAAG